MDEQKIAYLAEAVRAGSIRGAAERLQVNPATISRQIALLEAELGAALLERLARGVRATEAGRLLMEYHAQQRVARDDVTAKIRELTSLTRGTVQIAVGEGFIGDLLSGPLQEFCRRYPGLQLSVAISPTQGIVKAIVEDEAQIGIVFKPPFDERLQSNASMVRAICAIVPVGHPLCGLGHEPKLADLAGYPIAALDDTFGVQQLINEALDRDKVSLPPTIRTNSFTVLRQYVASGLGIGLMPAFVATSELTAGLVKAVPVDSPVLKSAQMHIITRHGRQLPPSALRLLLHLRSHLRAFGSGLAVE